MNLQHLRYAVEVDRTGSISQAAENLFMGQPNLSKAVKELEASLGIKLFKRTTKGVVTTPDGLEFLARAKKILSEMEELEGLYHPQDAGAEKLRLSVPRSSYITEAFAAFAQRELPEGKVSIEYSESSAMQTIQNVAEEGYHLGIIRYQLSCEPHFRKLLEEHQLGCKEVGVFERMVLFSKTHPAAKLGHLTAQLLSECTELYHGDCGVHRPARCEHNLAAGSKRRIGIYDRGSQFHLLARIPGSFLWATPVPAGLLESQGLVQRPCAGADNRCKDVLVYPVGHVFSPLETAFLSHLEQTSEQLKTSGVSS